MRAYGCIVHGLGVHLRLAYQIAIVVLCELVLQILLCDCPVMIYCQVLASFDRSKFLYLLAIWPSLLILFYMVYDLAHIFCLSFRFFIGLGF